MAAVVYILRSLKTGRYYIGCTTNLEQRLSNHNAGRTPSTKPYMPWELIYQEEYDDLSQARKRENYIKSLKSRVANEELVGAEKPPML